MTTPRFAMLLAFSMLAIPAAGDTLAINFSNELGEPLSNPPMTLGWVFEVNQPLNVTWLSFFDSAQDGLEESHAIGIWNSGGTLMVSGAVSAGTLDPLHDKFRAVEVSPTLLTPGTYRIGAFFGSGSDSNMFPTFTQGFVTAPEITYIRAASAVGGSLTNPQPAFFHMGPAYFGPNFEFQSIPEPGTMALVGVFVMALGLARRGGLRQRKLGG